MAIYYMVAVTGVSDMGKSTSLYGTMDSLIKAQDYIKGLVYTDFGISGGEGEDDAAMEYSELEHFVATVKHDALNYVFTWEDDNGEQDVKMQIIPMAVDSPPSYLGCFED